MRYRDVLHAPWWTYAVIVGLSAMLSFTFAAAITVPFGFLFFVVLVAVATLFIWNRRLEVSVDDKCLRVGSSELDLSQIAEVTALDEAGMSMLAGPMADTRARLVMRNLACKTGVKIELASGKTPYWLISSKHPEELAQALARVASPDE